MVSWSAIDKFESLERFDEWILSYAEVAEEQKRRVEEVMWWMVEAEVAAVLRGSGEVYVKVVSPEAPYDLGVPRKLGPREPSEESPHMTSDSASYASKPIS